MTKTTRTQLLYAGLFFGLTTILFSSALYIVHREGRELLAQHELLRAQSEIEASYRQMEQIATASQVDRKLINEFFITERDVITFITIIEERARASRVTVETTQLAVDPADEKENTPSQLKIGFSVMGTKIAVTEFLAMLEAIPLQKSIVSMTLEERAQDNAWSGNIILHIVIAS